jgi:hypothetical protein
LYRKFPDFTTKRIKANIFVKVIAIGDDHSEPAEKSDRQRLPSLAEDSCSSYVIIYESKVAMMSITNSQIPYGVVIEDKGLAAMQRLLFNNLWVQM